MLSRLGELTLESYLRDMMLSSDGDDGKRRRVRSVADDGSWMRVKKVERFQLTVAELQANGSRVRSKSPIAHPNVKARTTFKIAQPWRTTGAVLRRLR
jgi:hypothetical protein